MDDWSEWAKATYNIVIDPKLEDKEIKLYCILELLYNEKISLRKSFELCTKIGLFSDCWMNIDYKLSNIWNKYFNKME